MRQIHPLKTGAALGVVLGLYHLVWASLVALGWAKPLMDFILRLHFIRFDYAIEPFALATAAALVAITAAVGMLFGLVFALVWNRLASPQARPPAS